MPTPFQDTLDYFLSLSLPIMEVYGMSENSGPCTVSKEGHHRTGSTGKVFPGTELKIDNPDADGNGEICMRGRHVFMGWVSSRAAVLRLSFLRRSV